MNKKLTITLLGTIGLCVISASSVFAATGEVTGNSVRMREKANTDSAIVTKISKGTKVEVDSQENDWYKVTYNNKEGYIYKDYISVELNEEEETNEEVTSEEATLEETSTKEDIVLSNKLYSNSDVYLTACYSSSTIGKIEKGTEISIDKTIANWSYVSNESIAGWIPNYKLIKVDNETEDLAEDETKEVTTINKRAYVSSTSAYIRKGPGKKYDTLGGVTENEVVTVLSEENDWYKIKTQDNITGYVSKALITIGEKKVTNRSDTRDVKALESEKKKETTTKKKTTTKKTTTKKTTKKTEKKEDTKKSEDSDDEKSSSSADEKRKELVAFAKKYLGYKYVHGGASPKTGFDCSGFTSYVFGHFGYKLSRSSSAQASNGTHVDKSNLKVGDLLIFTGHVGIYIGNGKFIHSSNPRDGVKITKLSDSYYVKNYKDARRIIK